MGERRLEATVIGPGASGLLKVAIGRGQGQFVADVPVDRLPDSLRSPNSQFVAADAPDEYDSYIGRIYALLQREQVDDVIVGYLRQIETESMGLGEPSAETLRAVVSKLRQLKLPTLTR